MKITGGLLILFLAVLTLGGCLELREAGPCYGVGCPVFSSNHAPAAQPQSSASQTAPTQQTQTAAKQANSPARKKSHGIHALLHKVKL